MSGKFYSTKRYGNDAGFSCCFRQWRSTHSHCSLVHGYSIGFKVVFECDSLDERNWVYDFGGLKEFKQWLTSMFDHTLVVAEDDPHLALFKVLSETGVADVRIVPAVGCEKFAQMAYERLEQIINHQKASGSALNPSARVLSVEAFEHEGNSAVYKKEKND